MSRPTVFKTVDEARRALADDAMGVVTHSADTVTVTTMAGVGIFSRREWLASQRATDTHQADVPQR